MKTNKKIFLCTIFFTLVTFFWGGSVFAEEALAKKIAYKGDGGYSLVERINLRRYVNGRYVGLTSKEVRSFLSITEPPGKSFRAKGSAFENDTWYDGSFYVQEDTKRNLASVEPSIHDSIQSIFHISPEGWLTMFKDNGYPSFRNFPAFPKDEVKVGDTWKAKAERSVDPLNKGVFTKIPMLVLYTFVGEETYSVGGSYKGEPVYRIRAIWQTKYGKENVDFAGDLSLEKALGGHKADIIVLKKNGVPILVTDTVDETFVFVDGTQVNFKGNITLFTEFPVAVDSQKIMLALNRVATVKTDGEKPSAGKSLATGDGAGLAPGDSSGGALMDSSSAKQSYGLDVTELASGFKDKIDDKTTDLKNNILAEETPAGIRLSIRDIKFAPDSADILRGEESRLDQIAEVLKLAPNSKFLVEGHTASVGRTQGEQVLSEQRARRICEELVKRGVVSADFICRGFGGTRPVASNDSEEGRAQNRRVEITILK